MKCKKNIYDEKIYTRIKVQDLIIFSVYSIFKNNEVCTFERLVAECFTNFPKVFCFKRYPQWPDSLKLDRPLRTLRDKGLIMGGAGGNYSSGEFIITDFGIDKAKEIESKLTGKQKVTNEKRKLKQPRSIDEKLLIYLKENEKYKEFLANRELFSISEVELRNILRCTLETPTRVLKQNLQYCKKVAQYFGEKHLIEFLNICERLTFEKGGKDA